MKEEDRHKTEADWEALALDQPEELLRRLRREALLRAMFARSQDEGAREARKRRNGGSP